MNITHTVGENGKLYERYNITDIDGEVTGEHTVVTSQLCEVIHKLEARNKLLEDMHGAQTRLWPDDE
jgi:hypothetical protein